MQLIIYLLISVLPGSVCVCVCVWVNEGEMRKEEREEGRKEIERKGTARNRQ